MTKHFLKNVFFSRPTNLELINNGIKFIIYILIYVGQVLARLYKCADNNSSVATYAYR